MTSDWEEIPVAERCSSIKATGELTENSVLSEHVHNCGFVSESQQPELLAVFIPHSDSPITK
jgi:hypothetical protein